MSEPRPARVRQDARVTPDSESTHDHGPDAQPGGSRTASRRRAGADVSALTGIGLMFSIVSLVLARVVHSDGGAMGVGIVAVVPFGAAVVLAFRRRSGRAVLVPLVLFVLTATLAAVRIA
jgi:hypothetical protein